MNGQHGQHGGSERARAPRRSKGARWGAAVFVGGALVGGAAVAAYRATTVPARAAAPHAAPHAALQVRVPIPESDRLREQAIATVENAVVRVTNVGQGLGSGVTISKGGYIATNYHVVAGASRLTVTMADGRTLNAKLVGTDPVDDIAVVKVTAAGLPMASLGGSRELKLGQSVLAIGNPLGIGTTVTDGIVSALNRTVDEGPNGPKTAGSILNAIQTSAAINPGNSGGALINLGGEVVGIPTLSAVDPEFNAPANGVGFAIPARTVQTISSQIIRYGHVVHSGRPYLGLSLAAVTPDVAQQMNLPIDYGVVIQSVSKGSPASQAGLRPGEIIVALGRTPITTYDDLLQALARYKPQDTVTVRVVTPQKKQRRYTIKLGEFPIAGQR